MYSHGIAVAKTLVLLLVVSCSHSTSDGTGLVIPDFEAATFLEPLSPNVDAVVSARQDKYPIYFHPEPSRDVSARDHNVRLCAVTTEFADFDNNGGIGTFFSELVASASRAWSWDVSILYTSVPDSSKLADFKRRHPTVSVHVLNCDDVQAVGFRNSFSRFRAQKKSYCVARWLYSQDADGHGFDVVHFHENAGIGAATMHLRALGLAFSDTKFVTTAHGDSHWAQLLSFRFYNDVHHLHLTQHERIQLRDSDFVVSPSSYMLDHAHRWGWRLPPNNSFVIPNLIRDKSIVFKGEEAPSTWEHCHNPVREIVFLGRLEPRKGLDVMVGAVQKLAQSHQFRSALNMSELVVSFMGRSVVDPVLGDTAEWIREQHANGAWRDATLKLLTTFGRDQVFAYFRNSSSRVAVIPSLNENSPYTVSECLHYGIPLIASAVGGIPDLIARQDREKILFRPPTAAALAAKLTDVLLLNSYKPATPNTHQSQECERNHLLAHPVMNAKEIADSWLNFHETIVFNAHSQTPLHSQSRAIFGVSVFAWFANELIGDVPVFVKRMHSLLLALSSQSVSNTTFVRVVAVLSESQRNLIDTETDSGFVNFEASLQAIHKATVRIIADACSGVPGSCPKSFILSELSTHGETLRAARTAKDIVLAALVVPADEMPLQCAVSNFATAAHSRILTEGQSGILRSFTIAPEPAVKPARNFLGDYFEETDAWKLVQSTEGCSSIPTTKCKITDTEKQAQTATSKNRKALHGYLRDRLKSHQKSHRRQLKQDQTPCTPAETRLYFPRNVEGSNGIEASASLAFIATVLSSFQETPLPQPNLQRNIMADILSGASKAIFLDEATLIKTEAASLNYLAPTALDQQIRSTRSPLTACLTASLRGGIGCETIELPLFIPLSSNEMNFGVNVAGKIRAMRASSEGSRVEPAAEVLKDIFESLWQTATYRWLVGTLSAGLSHVGQKLLHPNSENTRSPLVFIPQVVSASREPGRRLFMAWEPSFKVMTVSDAVVVAEGSDATISCGGLWVSSFDSNAFAHGNYDTYSLPCTEGDTILGRTSLPSKRYRNAFITIHNGEVQLRRTMAPPVLEIQPSLFAPLPGYLVDGELATVVIGVNFVQQCGDGVHLRVSTQAEDQTHALPSSQITLLHEWTIEPGPGWQIFQVELPAQATAVQLQFGCVGDCYCDRVRYAIEAVAQHESHPDNMTVI